MYVCVTVSVDRHSPHLEFKTLQYQTIWASYDLLEKTIIQSFAVKASVKRKSLQTLRPLHGAFVCTWFNVMYNSRQAIHM